jgi:hypothetical protein
MSRTYHATQTGERRPTYTGKEAAEAYRRRMERQAARLAKYAGAYAGGEEARSV